MGSDLYDVKVASREGAKVKLDVTIVHPDAGGVPADPSFALMMMRDAAGDDDPLGQEVSYDDVLDAKWMAKYAGGFVLSVTGGSRGKKPTKGTLTITASHPAWVKHLRKGKRFDSRAFQNATKYRAAAPIVPEVAEKPARSVAKKTAKEDASAPIEADARSFIWVPKQVFAEYIDPTIVAPELFEMPAYGDKSYAATETVEPKQDREKLASWSGHAVATERAMGTLVASREGGVAIYRYTEGSRSFRPIDPDTQPISRIGLRKGARLNTRLGYGRVLDAMTGALTGAVVEGNVATLTIAHGPKSASTMKSATDVLGLLARALPGWGHYDLKGDEPLARALRRASVFLGGRAYWQDTLPHVASTFITRHELEPVPAPSVPDLDGMSSEDVRAFFLARPFGIGRLVVEVSDPGLVAHLARPLYVPLRDFSLPAPAPWPPRPDHGPLDAATVDWDLLGLRFDDERVFRAARPGSPGATSDLEVGNVVTAVNGDPVSTRAELEQALMMWAREGAPRVELLIFKDFYATPVVIELPGRAPAT